MNKKTRALTEEQYRKIITTINEGFVTAAGERVKPNSRIATALTLEANLGLRISDILHLTINQIVKDGDRYRLDLVEQKTGKKREFTVPTEIYIYIQNYALENNINPRARLFQITERTVQRHLKMVPEGLVPNGYIYNHYYNDKEIEETCCLRYPHLSDCEHGIRKVLQSKECEEWFNGTDTIVSSHDLISEVLQADWDGDHICLVHDKHKCPHFFMQ